MEKGLKNNSENFFLKNSPFLKHKPRAKRKSRVKRISVHALSCESQALSAQPLHLRLIWSAKLAKDELSQLQFDLNSAKLQPDC